MFTFLIKSKTIDKSGIKNGQTLFVLKKWVSIFKSLFIKFFLYIQWYFINCYKNSSLRLSNGG